MVELIYGKSLINTGAIVNIQTNENYCELWSSLLFKECREQWFLYM